MPSVRLNAIVVRQIGNDDLVENVCHAPACEILRFRAGSRNGAGNLQQQPFAHTDIAQLDILLDADNRRRNNVRIADLPHFAG